MKVLIADLPDHEWWGQGVGAYDDNWGMKDGVIPDQELLKKQHTALIQTIQKYAPVEVVPAPKFSDYPGINDDYVFIRDQFITGADHSIIICNLRRPERKRETDYISDYFDAQDIPYQTLPQGAIADGGEFHYLPKEKLLFAGLGRNNRQGVEAMADALGIKNVVLVETKAYHLDTVFSVVMDKDKSLVAIITSLEMLKHPDHIVDWAKQNQVKLLNVSAQDTLGTRENPGNQASNSFALPGLLFGNSHFETPGVQQELDKLGIEHIVIPTSQFNLLGGSVHCLINEL